MYSTYIQLPYPHVGGDRFLKKHLLDYTVFYSTLLYFWQVEKLVELMDGRTGCSEVVRDGCLVAWNFSVTSSAVLTEVERRH
jgi:hypothetical protein